MNSATSWNSEDNASRIRKIAISWVDLSKNRSDGSYQMLFFKLIKEVFSPRGKRSFCHRCHNRRERQGFFYPETFPCEAHIACHIVKDHFARTVSLGASVRVAVGKVIKKSRHVESGIVVFIFMRWSIPWLMARTFAEALRFRFFPTLDSI